MNGDSRGQPVQLLTAGTATAFLARLGDGARGGARTPVVTLEAPALLSLPAAPEGWSWVVGTGLGAELVDLPADPAVDDESWERARAGAVRTVDALGDMLRPVATPPPRQVVRLQRRPTYVAAGRVGVVDGASWIRVVEGDPTLLGAQLPSGGGPLPGRVALAGDRYTMVATVPWDEVDGATLLSGVAWLFDRAARQALADGERRQKRAVQLARSVPAANRDAERLGVSLLNAELAAEPPPPTRPHTDPLLTSADVVGDHEGLTIVSPETGLIGREGTDAVRAVALASGLYTRRVSLLGRWWERSTSAVLGFRPDGTPVALVPERESMVAVDPDGERHPIDEITAERVLDTGFVFARPFAEPSLGPRALLAAAWAGRGRLALGFLAWSAVIALVGLTVPLASGVVFGEIIPESDRSRLAVLIAVLIVAAVAVLPLQMVASIARTRLEAPAQFDLQRRLFGRILRNPPAAVQQLGPGDATIRLAALEYHRDAFDHAVLVQASTVLGSLLAAVVLFTYDVVLATIAVGAALAFMGLAILLARAVAREQAVLDEATGAVHGFVLQVLSAIPKLRIAGAESRAFLAWADRFRGAVGQPLSIAQGNQALLTALLPTLGPMALLGGAALIGPDDLDVGTFMAFQVTYGIFLAGVTSAVGAVGTLLQLRPVLTRAAELGSGPVESSGDRTDPGPLRGAVALRGVTFRYQPNTRPVLDDLSLRIEPSELVAITGRSGSGKSTILRLLLGFEEPEQGSVLYDDVDLTSLDVQAVRRQLGVVLQEGQLMPGTVRDNLVGLATLSDDEVWELAELVALADDIRAMPMGLDTVITVNGGAFSGGQRQRLLIARALATRPRILLLDEATSALDNVTQRVITQNLAELGMTRVVIAHRLSTMIDADRILVLDRGRVVEEGTYDELMRRRGAFHALAARQVLHGQAN